MTAAAFFAGLVAGLIFGWVACCFAIQTKMDDYEEQLARLNGDYPLPKEKLP